MGEVKRRVDLGMMPESIRPGQQIQVNIDLEKSPPRACHNCGSIYFNGVVTVHIVSPLMSPTGQQLIAHIQTYICAKCQTPFMVNPPEKKEN
jgi:DNA-directed RNA polymerase subunit RPC12/RpoP